MYINIKKFTGFGLNLLTALFLLSNHSFAQNEAPVRPEETNKILAQITHNLNGVENLKAKFIQNRHLSILIDPLISEGYCLFAKPDRLRWEIYTPYHSILIYNQNQLGKFDLQDGALRKLNLGTEDLMREILKQIIHWMQGNFDDARKIYNLEIYDSPSMRLVLIPKSEDLLKNIRSIELRFSKDITVIESVKIVESETDFTHIRFVEVVQNTTIAPGVFDTENPEIIKPTSR